MSAAVAPQRHADAVCIRSTRVIHSALLRARPNDFPYLEVTRPDSDEVGWWRGTKDGAALVGQFVDALWGGVDQCEVTGWSMSADVLANPSARPTWRVDCRSVSRGAFTLLVEAHAAPTAAAGIRSAMVALGLEPGATPATFEHLLWNAFLTIADDVEVQMPDGVGVAIDEDHLVWGPWAPSCHGWSTDDADTSPFLITLRWYLDPLVDNRAAQVELVEALETSFSDLADRAPIVVLHNLPTVDREGERLDALREGLARLERDGWNVVDEGVEWPDRRDEQPSIRVELEAWLTLEPLADADTGYDDEGDPENSEIDDGEETGESSIEFVVGVPFDRATLDAIEVRMVGGERPDAAVLAITGSITLPRVD